MENYCPWKIIISIIYLWFTLAVNWTKLVTLCRKFHLHSFRVQSVPLVHQPAEAGEEQDEKEVEEERDEKYRASSLPSSLDERLDHWMPQHFCGNFVRGKVKEVVDDGHASRILVHEEPVLNFYFNKFKQGTCF